MNVNTQTMNRFKLAAVYMLGGLLVLSACQQEIEEIVEPDQDAVLAADAPVTDLLQRTAARDGSDDNILDRSSCTSLVLPVTVIVNGREMVVETVEQLVEVEHILDRYDDDDDYVQLVFPVRVILPDHSEITISDEDAFEDLVDDCTEDGYDDDIECIDFKFPLELSIYDTQNQLQQTITIHDDKALYEFLDDLDDDKIAGFRYPLVLILPDGTEFTVNNNEQLEEALEDAVGSCDEDDDNDYNDDDVDDTDLRNVLTEGSWVISYYYDDQDETGAFKGYVFNFYADGTAKASDGNNTTYGTWFSNGDDGSLELDLDFGEADPWDEIEEDWDVLAFDNATVSLADIDDDDADYLTFSRPSDGGGGGDDTSGLSAALIEGSWRVASYVDSGENETSVYSGFALDFRQDGTVIATRGGSSTTGSWSAILDGSAEKLRLDFGDDDPLDELNEDWRVASYSATRVALRDDDDDGGVGDTLILEKI
jgi:hypothetical protein